jgi:hypothetical protein
VSPSGVLYLCPEVLNEVFALRAGRLVEVVSPRQLADVDPRFPVDNQLDPAGLAFDSAGDLFMYTTDPFAVVVRTVSGDVRYVGVLRASEDTDAFAAAPNGTLIATTNVGIVRFSPAVPAAGSGGASGRPVVDFASGKLFPHPQYLAVGGVAVSPTGDVVTDGTLFGGAGDESGHRAVLVEVTPSGTVHLLGQW